MNAFRLTAALLLAAALSSTQAQHQPDEKYIVTTYGDTTYCDDIRIKQLSVTCQTRNKKIDIRNENVRRIFMPVKESDWQDFFTAYAHSGKKTLYPYSPGQVQKVVTRNVYPRFFDLKPLDEEKDFWKRGLFEIIAQHNGYKLCKLKAIKSETPNFADGGDDINKFVLFEEYASSGVVMDKNNYRELLSKLVSGCSAAEEALKNKEINYFRDVPAFLKVFATCN